jgi:hypothetical protein
MIMQRVAGFLVAAVAVALLSSLAQAQQGAPAKSPLGVGPPATERSFTPPRPGTEAVTPAGPVQRL